VTQKITVNGYIRAVADQNHPLQTKLSLILTDFLPNGNKQGIPQTEKQNIIQSALHMPLKINFDGNAYSGHSGAIPVGPIVSVYEGKDNGRDVIAGDAVIWNEVYDDIAEHLKVAFSEGIGTSWEIFYDNSEIDSDGNEWLHGCVFAGTCVVQVPAYGPNRTRVLAIAEKLHEREETLLEITEKMSVNQNQAQADDLTTVRQDLDTTRELLFQLWEGLDGLYNSTFEIEAETVETDIGKIAASFAERISKLADEITNRKQKLGLSDEEMSRLTSELDGAKEELDQLKREKEEAEAAKAKAELTAARKGRLAESGIDEDAFNAKSELYLAMSDEIFDAYVADLSSVRTKSTSKAEAGLKPLIPEPLSDDDKTYSIAEIAEELRKQFRR
jgi:hypothetical protein